MKELNFQLSKSKDKFRSNYKLHDLAENAGKNLLVQWGIDFKNFGEDKRYEKVWEHGEDKPDALISYNGKSVFLDWKGKHGKSFILNERAVKSYERWCDKYNTSIVIVFFLFDDKNNLIDRRFAHIPGHKYVGIENKQWDKNKTVKFKEELPKFTKENLVKNIK